MWYNRKDIIEKNRKKQRRADLRHPLLHGAFPMKKRQFAAAISSALCAALLLSSCSSGSATSFSSNWYSDTTLNTAIAGTTETLVYRVGLEPDSGANSAYSVMYSDGTYTATLTVESVNGENLYCYRTSLEISNQYYFGDEVSDVKADKVTSEVYFRSTQAGLRPVSSFKEVESRSPALLTPESLNSCYIDYHFSVQIEYEPDGSAGKSTYTDLTAEEPSPRTSDFSIETGDNSYIDNEEILFALRGVTYDSAKSFQVYNASVDRVQTVRATPSESDSDSFDFSIGGEEGAHSITYYPVSIGIAEEQSGGTQTAWYAGTTDTRRNTYRNVMLRLETPLAYSLGTLVYELQSAEFANTSIS